MTDIASLLPSLFVYGLLLASAVILIWKVRVFLTGKNECDSCSYSSVCSYSSGDASSKDGSCQCFENDGPDNSDNLTVIQGARK